MLSITYISSAVELFSDDELVDLLNEIRPINAQFGITGLLLYHDGNIIQTIEGPDKAIEEIFGRIRRDRRHKDVNALLEQQIGERQFPDWAMGFHNARGISKQSVAGFSSFLQDPVLAKAFGKNPEPAYQLLTLFRRYIIQDGN